MQGIPKSNLGTHPKEVQNQKHTHTHTKKKKKHYTKKNTHYNEGPTRDPGQGQWLREE